MGLPVLILAQALVSFAPTLSNVRTLPETAMSPVAIAVDNGSDRLYAGAASLLPDSVRRHRAVMLSDGYYKRLDVHRIIGYGVLPLFLLQYLSGQQELEKGSAAPLWADKVHKPAAYLLAGAFTVNTVTGLWNLAAASKVQRGKTRRWVHSVVMLASDAAMVYGVAKAPTIQKIDARIAAGKRGGWTPHKAFTITSMGLATVGELMMYIWKE
jgi:hypothetical protein